MTAIIRFIGYPGTVQYKIKGSGTSKRGKTAINHLLWGDYAKVLQEDGDWSEVRCRGRNGWVHGSALQKKRILEVNFVDIGQGDGCHIQTPDDRALVIDAGEKDNMYRFLRWRFGKFSRRFLFEAFVMSHPDKDHYYGFREFFSASNPEARNVHIQSVFHNSIIEQKSAGKAGLGKHKKVGRTTFLNGLVHTLDALKPITDSDARRSTRLYPNLLKDMIDSGRVTTIESLHADPDFTQNTYVPGFAPADDRGMTLKILGPVPRHLDGQMVLPYFKDDGKTKNGHSVVLLLEIGTIKMLLGGDLNEPSQQYLMKHYTGLDPKPASEEDAARLVEEARATFQVDIAKACHHGSAHVDPLFLKATNPIATIVSSGDDEPHSHPRPDTLGMIGKFSRSLRPLIFSTELARSGNEHIKHPNKVRAELKDDLDSIYTVLKDPQASAAAKKRANKSLDEKLEIIQRSVANYGMINVRTNGNKLIIAQRLERERSKSKRWDIYQFECDDRGRLHYVTH